jgi:4-amino-4-deoxy-L-arabinose transferase-like glycosyltransferase
MHKKDWLMAGLLVILALGLKLHQPVKLGVFNPEIAQHYWEIIKLKQGLVLLQGPLTSHEWLRLSALPYYFFYPVMRLTGFHPLSLYWFWQLVAAITVGLNYLVICKVLGRKTAILSSFMLLIIPGVIKLDRWIGFFNLILPLSLLMIWWINKLFNKETKQVWPLFLLASLMFSVHASALMLIPTLVGWMIYTKLWSREQIGWSVLAFLGPQLPLIFNDAQKQFSTSLKMIAWVPYRALKFLGAETLGTGKIEIENESFVMIGEWLEQSIWPIDLKLGGLFLAVLLIVIAGWWYWQFKRQDVMRMFLWTWLVFGLIALFIHQNPPFHYFAPLALLPVIIGVDILVLVTNKFNVGWAAWFIVAVMMIVGMNNWYQDIYLRDYEALSSFEKRRLIAEAIIADAGTKSIYIERVGEFNQYPGEYKEDWEYLLWWLGANLDETGNKYEIREGKKHFIDDNNLLELEDIQVFKVE